MIKPDTDYAVTLLDVPMTPLRPLRGVWVLKHWEVHDPDDPLDYPAQCSTAAIKVHGEWDAQTHPMVGRRGVSWSELAADQMRHVKRQRELAVRLTEIGIRRDPEPYIHRFETVRALDIDLTLTYDEIDLLLRRGGA